MQLTKSALRRQMQSLRQQLSAAEIQHGSAAIADAFLNLPDLADGQAIHVFLPMTTQPEVNTWLLIERLRAHFAEIRLVVSCSDFNTCTLSHYLLTPDTVIEPNRWGIPEPVAAQPFDVRQLDWVVIPLLCFDQRGYRVGYGKGFYDRFLQDCRADVRKVGVSLLPPVPEISDVNAFDVPLDVCLERDTVWQFAGFQQWSAKATLATTFKAS